MKNLSSVEPVILMQEALEAALSQGDTTKIELLIRDGIDIDIELESDRNTPLIEAVEFGCIDTVRFLVESGANVNASNSDGYYPLLIAATYGFKDIFDYLAPLTKPELRAEAEEELPMGILFRDKRNNSFVENFIDDCAVGNLDGVLEAIDKGIDVNAIGADDDPAIVIAARTGQIAVIKTLVRAGADVTGRGMGYYSDETALMGSVSCLSIGGLTAYSISEQQRGRLYEAISLLLDLGADVNIKTKYGDTALHGAVNVALVIKSGRVVKMLLDAGADVHAKNNRGESPLDYAREYAENTRDDAIVKLLTDFGA